MKNKEVTMNIITKTLPLTVLIVSLALSLSEAAPTIIDHLGKYVVDDTIKVSVDNYVRAETAFQFDLFVKMAGGVNKWTHNRQPTPFDKLGLLSSQVLCINSLRLQA